MNARVIIVLVCQLLQVESRVADIEPTRAP